MSTGVETTQIVEPWLYSTLAADPSLTELVGGLIINATAEEMENDPDNHVVFSFASSRDIRGIGTTRVQVDCIYLVKAVVRGQSYTPATPIFARIDALLSVDGTVSTEAGDLTCVRETITQYPERQDGAHFRHLGGTYRIRVNSA